MIELRILGSPDMVGADGSQLLSVLHRPKSLALLSYLAVEGLGDYQRRDRLLGLFWPEAEERKARSSLSEALSRLRQSLGPRVILTRGSEEIALSPSNLWVDASALLAAAENGTLDKVARLYRGPLLDGFFLDESLGFDHWLDSTRARFERVALEALGNLTDAAAAEGDASAMTWAERAVALSPTDAASVRRLMTLLSRSGHRTSALDAFDHYVRRIADERGLEPSEDMADLASRVRSGDLTDPGQETGERAPARSTSSGVHLRLLSGGPEADVDSDRVGEHEAGSLPEPLPDPVIERRKRPSVDVQPVAQPWKRIAVALATITIALAAVAIWSALSDPTLPVVRSDVTPPSGSRLVLWPGDVVFTLAPDGERIVYVGEGPDGRQLWDRRLDELEPTPIPGTEGATAPVFSPDGTSVLFMQDNDLKTVSLAGGPPFTVVDGLEAEPFLDWGSDGLIYYARGGYIYRVPAEGGEPEQVTAEFRGADVRLPHVLPDGRGLLVTLRRDFWTAAIGVVGPEGGEIRELFRGTTARYSASGEIVYATMQGELMAVPFDLDRLEPTGSPVAILEGVLVRNPVSTAEFALSGTGSLVYFAPGTPPSYQAVWVDRGGRASEIDPGWTFGGDGRWSGLALSPTGDRLALSAIDNAGVDIWIKRLDGAPAERFTFTGRGNHRPAWSHDGAYVAYVGDRSQGEWETVRRRSDGTGEVETLMSGGVNTAHYSRDGDWLVYAMESSSADIFALRLGVDRVGRALLADDAYHEFNPVLSPDGRWLAYNSDETGRFEVYVRSFPDVGSLKRQVSTEGGTEAVWSRSGRELFYRNGAGELVSVEVIDEPTFSVRAQSVLFSAADFLASFSHPIYDVRQDDQAFVMLREVAGREPDRLILVQNLFGSR